MRDEWYGDKRDLVKWAVTLELARRFQCLHILQVLYYRPNGWPQIEIDGEKTNIANEVIRHFRDVESICKLQCGIAVQVVKEEFDNRRREEYAKKVSKAIRALSIDPSIVFLDPDTGLEPRSGKLGPTHTSIAELREIWDLLRKGDLLVFYQHEDNRAGREWKERKRLQFAEALEMRGTRGEQVKLAHAPAVARDVAFFFVRKD